MSVNKVILVGNVGQNPERRGDQASFVVTFNVATHETRKDKEGNRVRTTEWHRVVTFGKLGELCLQYLKKGKQVYVEGRIRSRVIKREEGELRVFEIVASDVKFIDSDRTARDNKSPSQLPLSALKNTDVSTLSTINTTENNCCDSCDNCEPSIDSNINLDI